MNKRIAYALAITTVAAFAAFVVFRQQSGFQLEVLAPYQDLILEGVLNTIIVSVVTLLGSLIVGFLFYLLSISENKYFQALTDVFTEIVYGTPLLVLVVIMAFVIGPAFGTFNRNLMGYMSLIIYMTPYMKNIYKSSIASIGEEQYMAMDLFGFTPWQRYRYIIIPQVVRVLMPPMMNNFSMIIKGSALLNVLSYGELFYAVRIAQSKTFAFVEGSMLMWILYLIITIPLSHLTKYIVRRWGL